MRESKRKLVLLLQNEQSNDDNEIVVHVHEQIHYEGNIYVPVHLNDRVTLCRIDKNNGEECLTDDLTDLEFIQVQTIYQNQLAPAKL